MIFVDLAMGPMNWIRSIPTDELAGNALVLAQACRLLAIPVFFSLAAIPGPGGEVIPALRGFAVSEETLFHSASSSWQNEALRQRVAATNRKQLIFAGIAMDVGVLLTALDAQADGYGVHVVGDVCGTTDSRAEMLTVARMTQAGIHLHTLGSCIAELQRDYTKPPGPELLRLLRLHEPAPATVTTPSIAK